MKNVIAGAILLSLLVLPPLRAASQSRLVYRERTGDKVVRIEVWEERSPDGLILRSLMSNGDVYSIADDTSLATLSLAYANAAARTAYTATRRANTIRIEGIVKGKAVSRVVAIDSRPWYESVERSFQDLVISRSFPDLRFWTVLPAEGQVFLLNARREKTETVVVNGEEVETVRIRVNAIGLLSWFYWYNYWYRATDGTFLKSEGIRSGWGSPITAMELVEGTTLTP
jgi:hypothetical protein